MYAPVVFARIYYGRYAAREQTRSVQVDRTAATAATEPGRLRLPELQYLITRMGNEGLQRTGGAREIERPGKAKRSKGAAWFVPSYAAT